MSISSAASSYNTASIAGTTDSTTTTSTAMDELSGNYETFLTLLTSQLKNQDPLEPTDTSAFTQQLVQYSQVEQQIKTNDQLDDILSAINNGQTNQVLGYLGHTVEIQSNGIALQDGTTTMNIRTETAAASSTLEITDGTTGKVVRYISLSKLAGDQEVVWDGLDNSGNQLADGTYKVEVKAYDSAGVAIESTVNSFAKVTGVDLTEGEPYLSLGGLYVTANNILSITD